MPATTSLRQSVLLAHPLLISSLKILRGNVPFITALSLPKIKAEYPHELLYRGDDCCYHASHILHHLLSQNPNHDRLKIANINNRKHCFLFYPKEKADIIIDPTWKQFFSPQSFNNFFSATLYNKKDPELREQITKFNKEAIDLKALAEAEFLLSCKDPIFFGSKEEFSLLAKEMQEMFTEACKFEPKLAQEMFEFTMSYWPENLKTANLERPILSEMIKKYSQDGDASKLRHWSSIVPLLANEEIEKNITLIGSGEGSIIGKPLASQLDEKTNQQSH